MDLVPLYTWSFLNLRTVQKAAIYITFYVLSANNGVCVFIKPHLISLYDTSITFQNFFFEKLKFFSPGQNLVTFSQGFLDLFCQTNHINDPSRRIFSYNYN